MLILRDQGACYVVEVGKGRFPCWYGYGFVLLSIVDGIWCVDGEGGKGAGGWRVREEAGEERRVRLGTS